MRHVMKSPLRRRSLLWMDQSYFMSMPFAKYARMTMKLVIVWLQEGLFVFIPNVRAYNKFHIYRTLFIYRYVCTFENIRLDIREFSDLDWKEKKFFGC